jgi:hypothetical protein
VAQCFWLQPLLLVWILISLIENEILQDVQKSIFQAVNALKCLIGKFDGIPVNMSGFINPNPLVLRDGLNVWGLGQPAVKLVCQTKIKYQYI